MKSRAEEDTVYSAVFAETFSAFCAAVFPAETFLYFSCLCAEPFLRLALRQHKTRPFAASCKNAFGFNINMSVLIEMVINRPTSETKLVDDQQRVELGQQVRSL